MIELETLDFSTSKLLQVAASSLCSSHVKAQADHRIALREAAEANGNILLGKPFLSDRYY
jgi:hypothetical protein